MNQKTYRIGEAAAKLNLKSYVLRFWETEFPQIAPIRTEKGQRLYTESDLAVLGRIRYLLHERGLTIDGARRLLREGAAKGVQPTDAAMLPDDPLTDVFLDDAADEAELLAGGENPPAKPAPAPESRVSFQASLFPADGPAHSATVPPVRGAAPAVSAALSPTELHAVITELAAIRRLLVAATPGDAS